MRRKAEEKLKEIVKNVWMNPKMSQSSNEWKLANSCSQFEWISDNARKDKWNLTERKNEMREDSMIEWHKPAKLNKKQAIPVSIN